jgi:hypothetical protein
VRTRRRRVTGTAEIVAAVRSAKQFLTHAASGPFQYAGAKALRLPDAYFTAFREDLRTKRDLLGAGLADVGSRVFRPAGTYLITTNILGQREQKRPGAAILLRQGKEQPGRGGQVFLGAPACMAVVSTTGRCWSGTSVSRARSPSQWVRLRRRRWDPTLVADVRSRLANALSRVLKCRPAASRTARVAG